MSFIVYPAVDLRGGRVVRLKEGDPERMTAYSDDPSETARRWLGMGAGWLHVVNLDGAFGERGELNRRGLESILKAANETHANVQFGGGMRSLDTIRAALDLGASRVILGTVAVEEPEIVERAVAEFGAERIAAGIDARDGLVRVRGWTEGSGIPALDLAQRMRSMGLQTAIVTDISRDGLGTGLNIQFTQKLAQESGLSVIASGGVHTLDDVAAAREAGLAGVIIGRALYEGTIDLKEALSVV